MGGHSVLFTSKRKSNSFLCKKVALRVKYSVIILCSSNSNLSGLS